MKSDSRPTADELELAFATSRDVTNEGENAELDGTAERFPRIRRGFLFVLNTNVKQSEHRASHWWTRRLCMIADFTAVRENVSACKAATVRNSLIVNTGKTSSKCVIDRKRTRMHGPRGHKRNNVTSRPTHSKSKFAYSREAVITPLSKPPSSVATSTTSKQPPATSIVMTGSEKRGKKGG